METRKHFLSLDIGTTCCKAQLFDERGDILFYRSEECPLRRINGESYADLERIAQTVKALVREAAKAAPVSSLAFSSFGESFVLLDRQDRLLTLPMLYTDPRGSRQAQELEARFGRQKRLFRVSVHGEALHRLRSCRAHGAVRRAQKGVFGRAAERTVHLPRALLPTYAGRQRRGKGAG